MNSVSFVYTGNSSNVFVKVDGQWRKGSPYVKVDGQWRKATNLNIKVAGQWRNI